MWKIKTSLIGLLLFAPLFASANNITLDCATSTVAYGTGLNCATHDFVGTTGVGGGRFHNAGFEMAGVLLYVVVGSSGTTGNWGLNLGTTIDNITTFASNNGTTQFNTTPGGGTGATDLVIVFNGTAYAGNTNSGDADIFKVCVSDVSFADCGGTSPFKPFINKIIQLFGWW